MDNIQAFVAVPSSVIHLENMALECKNVALIRSGNNVTLEILNQVSVLFLNTCLRMMLNVQ